MSESQPSKEQIPKPELSEVLVSNLTEFFNKQKVLEGYVQEILERLKVENFEFVNTGKEKLFLLELLKLPGGQSLDLVFLPENTEHPPHIHKESSAYVKFFQGSGEAAVGEDLYNYDIENEGGKSLLYPHGVGHGFSVKRGTFILSLQNKPIKRADGTFDFYY